MRVLFTTTGHAGHVLPMLPFAHAAAGAGHDVLVATQHSRTGAVEAAGLAAAPVAEADPEDWAPVQAALRDTPMAEANRRMLAEGFGGLMLDAALPDTLALVEDWRPHLVVRETFEFAGALAAERHGVPVARVALGLQRTEAWAAASAAPGLAAARERLGLAPDPRGARLRRGSVLTAVPAVLETPFTGGGGRVARFRVAPSLIAPPDPWPGDPRPLVLLTLGSVASSLTYFPGTYRDAIAALAPLPVKLLVTVGHGTDVAALGPLPENVRAEGWIAQDAVLAHAAAVVGHGGYGTTLGALSHGVPLVLLPLFSSDQWFNAERVAELGAGIALTGGPRGAVEPPRPDVLAALPGALRAVLADDAYGVPPPRSARRSRRCPRASGRPCRSPTPRARRARRRGRSAPRPPCSRRPTGRSRRRRTAARACRAAGRRPSRRPAASP